MLNRFRFKQAFHFLEKYNNAYLHFYLAKFCFQFKTLKSLIKLQIPTQITLINL